MRAGPAARWWPSRRRRRTALPGCSVRQPHRRRRGRRPGAAWRARTAQTEQTHDRRPCRPYGPHGNGPAFRARHPMRRSGSHDRAVCRPDRAPPPRRRVPPTARTPRRGGPRGVRVLVRPVQRAGAGLVAQRSPDHDAASVSAPRSAAAGAAGAAAAMPRSSARTPTGRRPRTARPALRAGRGPGRGRARPPGARCR